MCVLQRENMVGEIVRYKLCKSKREQKEDRECNEKEDILHKGSFDEFTKTGDILHDIPREITKGVEKDLFKTCLMTPP